MIGSLEFTGRHVVVTGGTGALGTAIVRRLLALGATCHLPLRSAPRGDPFGIAGGEHAAPGAGGATAARVHVVPGVDLADEQAVERFFAGVPTLWASVHAAGGFAAAPLLETSVEAWRQQLDQNATAAFLCMRAALRRMNGEPGRIVNVAARVALEPRQGAGMAAYVASKAALVALTQAAAEEVRASGVLVNAVAPSVMDTPANRAAMPDAEPSTWPSVEDVAESVVWLASPGNRVVAGAVVPVPGRS